MNWQLGVSLALVLLAASYLGWSAWRFWRGRKSCGGCGSSCAPAAGDPAPPLISTEQITHKLRRDM